MIDVVGLSKRYGTTLALGGVTFSIQPGEVVGLLGPNGAGKTTMLKILTGYLPPTDGEARVANLNVQDDSLEIRRRIGYLPETNPLYEDLAVYESLQWTARLRRMPVESWDASLRHVIDVCGLSQVVGKDIATLSKGYRQRVGLAQAILHDPEILILDEPTSGLDPNQQQEVRRLIQTLKQKKTVILSTHILSEAQTACDRVLIINKGKIVADGTPDALGHQLQRGRRLHLEVKAPAEAARVAFSEMSGVDRVMIEKSEGASVQLVLESSRTDDFREAVFQMAVQKQWPILEMRSEGVSLDDVFRRLTTVS